MFFDGQPRQRDQRADFLKALDLAQMRQQTRRRQPADARNGLQALPDGFEVRMGFEMGFDLAFGGFELGLQRLDMRAHALLDSLGHAPSFQAVALLAQHVLHIIAMMQERTQGDNLIRQGGIRPLSPTLFF